MDIEHKDPFDNFNKNDWFWYILLSIGFFVGACYFLVKCNAIMM